MDASINKKWVGKIGPLGYMIKLERFDYYPKNGKSDNRWILRTQFYVDSRREKKTHGC